MATIRLLCRQLIRKPIATQSSATVWTAATRVGRQSRPQLMAAIGAGGRAGRQPTVGSGGGCGAGDGSARLWYRPMSYVSNAKRLSGRYRQSVRLVAIGVAMGPQVTEVGASIIAGFFTVFTGEGLDTHKLRQLFCVGPYRPGNDIHSIPVPVVSILLQS
ncbi:unnamed protein product, partial [Medioppia subpectinata]